MRYLGTVLVTVLMVAIALNLSACTLEEPPQYLPVENPQYRALDTPEAPVYNAFLALQQGDFEKVQEQYTAGMRSMMFETDQAWNVLPAKSDKLVMLGTRPRIGSNNPNHLVVKFKQVGYERVEFFLMATSFYRETSDEREVLVTRTEDGWKINAMDLFSYNGSNPPGIEL